MAAAWQKRPIGPYGSIWEAEAKTGIASTTIRERLRRGWSEEEALRPVGQAERVHGQAHAVWVEGVRYASKHAAADALGLNIQSVFRRCKRDGVPFAEAAARLLDVKRTRQRLAEERAAKAKQPKAKREKKPARDRTPFNGPPTSARKQSEAQNAARAKAKAGAPLPPADEAERARLVEEAIAAGKLTVIPKGAADAFREARGQGEPLHVVAKRMRGTKRGARAIAARAKAG